jgi:hypothetical protein
VRSAVDPALPFLVVDDSVRRELLRVAEAAAQGGEIERPGADTSSSNNVAPPKPTAPVAAASEVSLPRWGVSAAEFRAESSRFRRKNLTDRA